MPYSDNGYLDPVHIIWRKGTTDDPYIEKFEALKVANQTVILTEIPDRFYRVRIEGMTEINYEQVVQKGLKPDEFIVQYETGIVQFHKDKEASTVNLLYKGRGFVQYPTNRIYHQDGKNNIVETLYDIVENSKFFLNELDSIQDDYDGLKEIIMKTISEMQNVTDNANKSIENADIATEKALNASETTKLVFKPYVANFKQLQSTYPEPDVGWTVQTYEDGIRYRWDGLNWVEIDIFGQNLQVVNEFKDGLMSVDEHLKLKSIPISVKERVMVFCFPSYVFSGSQGVIARFPFHGEITSVRAFCGVHGDTDTEIDIEKTTDLSNWSSILGNKIKINMLDNFDDGTATLVNTSVLTGEMFRVNIPQVGLNLQNLTVEVIVKV